MWGHTSTSFLFSILKKNISSGTDNRGLPRETVCGQGTGMATTAGLFFHTGHRERLLTPALLKTGFLISQIPLNVPVLVTCKQSRMYSEVSLQRQPGLPFLVGGTSVLRLVGKLCALSSASAPAGRSVPLLRFLFAMNQKNRI